jgi:hypothetical protein
MAYPMQSMAPGMPGQGSFGGQGIPGQMQVAVRVCSSVRLRAGAWRPIVGMDARRGTSLRSDTGAGFPAVDGRRRRRRRRRQVSRALWTESLREADQKV